MNSNVVVLLWILLALGGVGYCMANLLETLADRSALAEDEVERARTKAGPPRRLLWLIVENDIQMHTTLTLTMLIYTGIGAATLLLAPPSPPVGPLSAYRALVAAGLLLGEALQVVMAYSIHRSRRRAMRVISPRGARVTGGAL